MPNNKENQTKVSNIETQSWIIKEPQIKQIRAEMIRDGKLHFSETATIKKKDDMQGLFLKLAEETLFPAPNSASTNLQRITEASNIFISTTNDLEKAYQNQEISDQQLEMATFLIKYQYQAYIKNK